MKNVLRTAGVIALALVIGMALVGCGGGSSSLAKEAFDLGNQLVKAMEDGDTAAMQSINGKIKDLGDKVKKLSPSDQLKYAEELAKLQGY